MGRPREVLGWLGSGHGGNWGSSWYADQLDAMLREQRAARELLDSGHWDRRGVEQWLVDSFTEECLIRLEETQ